MVADDIGSPLAVTLVALRLRGRGVRPFAPSSVRPHGLYSTGGLGNAVAGAFATLAVVAESTLRPRDGDDAGRPGAVVVRAIDRFGRRHR